MLTALTKAQWQRLKTAMKIEGAVNELENKYNTDLDDEGSRYEFRDAIVSLIEPFVSQNDYYTIKVILDRNGVLWGPYQTFDELVKKIHVVLRQPINSQIFQKGLGEFPQQASSSFSRTGGAAT